MRSSQRWRLFKNRLFSCVLFGLSFLLLIPLCFIIFHIVINGFSVINWEWLTQLPKPVGEVGGGVLNALLGSLVLISIGTMFSVPLGVLVAIFLAENSKGFLAKWIRLSVDTLQGIPSIVIGIVAYVWIVKPMGHFSALSGGIALAMIMIPLVIKTTEETLIRIPLTFKEAAFALGASYYKTMILIILPTGLNGITTGVLLGIARISGESAPLLFTAFGNPFVNFNLLKPVHSLPLMIFTYSTSPYESWQHYAWGGSFLLLLFVLGLTLLSKVVTRP